MKKIALLPGDGIGPDVTIEAVKVLAKVVPSFTYEEFSVGAGEFLKSGDPLPESVFSRLPQFDAILLGAMGLPNVRWPDGREMAPQIDLRERLDLYCGLRPIYLMQGPDSRLRNRKSGDIDLVMLRESTEGLFSTRLNRLGADVDQATDTMLITRKCAERISRRAFELARTRRKHVTLVDKANVLPSMVFFRRVFDEVAAEFPDIATDRVYVDAAALFLVERPERFDVLVTENMFGDILSDLGAGIIGGMGVAPSADLGDRYGIFQPSHGTAPDIAGKGIANPVATILSAAMMLDWLKVEGGDRIRAAVQTVFADLTARTRDMGGKMTTTEMGDAVVKALH